jgi:glycosyltransferase involved in cell wall biosynthesis
MHIVFISTNSIYGGSEILMLRSAVEFSKQFEVSVFTRYDHYTFVNKTSLNFINYFSKNNLKSKLINKIKGKSSDLKINLIKIKPQYVIISQGGPLSSLKEMEICISLKLPFVIINQLVCEYHWLEYKDNMFPRFKVAYSKSDLLFFVSKQNEDLFKQFFGKEFVSKQINNPVSLESKFYLEYPDDTEVYKIAYVGRYEFYHKGLDLLLEVLKQPIWLKRNVKFNFYGKGPHQNILKDIIERNRLSFCHVYEYTEDLLQVWSKNHISILPSRFEGKSLSITESMSYGRAAIITNVGGAKEQIDDMISGFICKNFSYDSLNNTLEKAWDLRNEWKSMGINARKKYLKENQVNPVFLLNQIIQEKIQNK